MNLAPDLSIRSIAAKLLNASFTFVDGGSDRVLPAKHAYNLLANVREQI